MLEAALTRRILGVYFEVYNELGFGFLETVYQAALTGALRSAGLRCDRERIVRVHFRGVAVGEFRPDLVVDDRVVVELKVARALAGVHDVQVINYLRATEFEVGLLLNFGPRAEFRRFVFANSRKRPCADPRSSA
jgi:GxxExxY protein